jgi:hypothetical protein
MLTFYVLDTSPSVLAVSEADARSAMVTARSKIIDCYDAVLDVEKAGANVTGLLSRLNDAEELSLQASSAYNSGNYDSAREFALQSQTRLNGFVEEINALWVETSQRLYWDFMINVVGSLAGAGVVAVGSYFFWSFLKRKYESGAGAV